MPAITQTIAARTLVFVRDPIAAPSASRGRRYRDVSIPGVSRWVRSPNRPGSCRCHQSLSTGPILHIAYGEQLPLALDALEGVRSAILHREVGSDDQITDRPGHQHLVRPRRRHHAGRDVDRHTADIV